MKCLTILDVSETTNQAEMENLVKEFYENLFSSERVQNMEQALDHVP